MPSPRTSIVDRLRTDFAQPARIALWPSVLGLSFVSGVFVGWVLATIAPPLIRWRDGGYDRTPLRRSRYRRRLRRAYEMLTRWPRRWRENNLEPRECVEDSWEVGAFDGEPETEWTP